MREIREEAIATTQQLDHDGLDQNNGSGEGENWSDSRYTLKIEPRKFANTLDVYFERTMVVRDGS